MPDYWYTCVAITTSVSDVVCLLAFVCNLNCTVKSRTEEAKERQQDTILIVVQSHKKQDSWHLWHHDSRLCTRPGQLPHQ